MKILHASRARLKTKTIILIFLPMNYLYTSFRGAAGFEPARARISSVLGRSFPCSRLSCLSAPCLVAAAPLLEKLFYSHEPKKHDTQNYI